MNEITLEELDTYVLQQSFFSSLRTLKGYNDDMVLYRDNEKIMDRIRLSMVAVEKLIKEILKALNTRGIYLIP